MSSRPRRVPGCGAVLAVLLVVVLIVAVIGWALSLNNMDPLSKRLPIPDDIPPAAGASVPAIDINAGGRTADALTEWSEPIAAATGIPAPALRAYANAELIAAQEWPDCRLGWTTLAGIGFVETKHGTYTGDFFNHASIDADGVARPPIIGIALDGSPGVAKLTDTDGGEFDGDTVYDRAVGPLQFIPSSWALYGLDASGDGYADPHNIDDAAAAAAKHLCEADRDVSTKEGWTEAVHSYNRSTEYLLKVRDAAANYALGQRA